MQKDHFAGKITTAMVALADTVGAQVELATERASDAKSRVGDRVGATADTAQATEAVVVRHFWLSFHTIGGVLAASAGAFRNMSATSAHFCSWTR